MALLGGLICQGLIAQETTSNNKRPKVGLVLSGGGAKGFAHVGVLKELEKYNIPIDYIAGTSIGAIIGGLYAVGYSASQIETMILTQDWESLFTNTPERIYLPFYEKDEQGRYLISMQLEKWKLFIPNYALTNNGIIELFSDLTLGYHQVDDFNQLPTPFLCITADLLTGKEVVLNSGYLPEAMAASMAIPGVFPSIRSTDHVYVDGGVRNNFPVDHVRALGADIVIGVDVGSGMQTAEELLKIGGIVDQLTIIIGSEKFVKNRKDCDLYIKPAINAFFTADFTHESAVNLLKVGELSGIENTEQLTALEAQFKDFSFPKREGYQPIAESARKMVTHFYIQGSRLSDNDILGIMGVSEETNLQCSIDDAHIGLERLHSSMKFSSIQYKLIEDQATGNYTLSLRLEENSENTINFGARYSSQDNVSLLFNGTFNTLILRNSRFSFDIKLSEVPAVDLRYNINRGSLPGLGVKYGYRGRMANNYADPNRIGEAKIDKHYFEINTNSVVNDYFTVGLGMRYEHFKLDHIIGTFPLPQAKYNYLLYRFFFELDTKDKAYYPTKGFKYISHTDLITDNGYELNDKVPAINTFLSMEQTIQLKPHWTITPKMYTQLQFVSNNTAPLFYKAYVGGYYQPHDIVNQVPFWGLRWGEFAANNLLMSGLENRFQIAKNHHVYLNINAFAHTESLSTISTENIDYKLGAAIGYSYNSLVGPIEVFFSMSNSSKLRSFVNIGYSF